MRGGLLQPDGSARKAGNTKGRARRARIEYTGAAMRHSTRLDGGRSADRARLTAALYEQIRAAQGHAHAARFHAWREHWERTHGPPGRKRAPDLRQLAAPYGLDPHSLDLPALLYAAECCFVFRTRLLAAAALGALRSTPPSPAGDPAALPLGDVPALVASLLAPRAFAHLGVTNDGGAELFDFTGYALPPEIWELLRAEIAAAWREAPETAARHDLRAAYHRMLPKQLRHALGAYYTPPWLAAYVVETLWELRGPNGGLPRAIDPACGSGVFLTAALTRLVTAAREQGATGADLLRAGVRGVVGIDIDPLAVHAARASLLLALAELATRELVAFDEPIELPVYLGDGLDPGRPSDGPVPFDVPGGALAGPFDLVVGNPPWVNWEYLPPAYRARCQHLWGELGLFALRGRQKAFSKEDVAALFTYAACRRYGAPGGLLGFLLPQSLFKSSLNGRGFRRLRLGPDQAPLRVLQVDDLVAVRPFAGAGARPAALFLQAGRPTRWPATYRRWQPAGRQAALPETWDLAQVRAAVTISSGQAVPSDPDDPASPWADGPPAVIALLERLTGTCAYRARTGMFTGGANGVFYVELIEELPDGLLRVRNLAGEARRGVAAVEAVIEPEYVFPLLRGRDVAGWSSASRALVLCPHTAASRMAAVPPEELRARAPRTYAYLEQFREALSERRGFAGWERRFQQDAFYTCQRIGAYTFAPYKVVWRYIATTFRCAVVEPGPVGSQEGRPVIPHEKLMQIACDSADEAYFVCGVLSSAPARLFVERRMVETQIAPHVIARLALPRYDAADERHRQIVAHCRSGHRARARGDEPAAAAALEAINTLIPGVLPLSAAEVRAAAAALTS